MQNRSGSDIEVEVASMGRAPPPFVHACPDDRVTLALPLYLGQTRMENEGRVVFEGRVTPGMMRLGLPGDRVKVTRNSSAKALFLGLPKRSYDRVVSEIESEGRACSCSGTSAIIGPHPHVKALASALLTEGAMTGARRQTFLAGLVQSLLAVLVDAQERGADAGAVADGPGLTTEQFRLCRDFADDRLGEGVDLHDWAGRIGLPTSEFSRRFHATSGSAPYAWFLGRRIERAQDLLLTSRKPMVELALDLGFCSQSHFTQAFHKRVGTSPARWRAAQGVAGS